jgi:hypothetical protein
MILLATRQSQRGEAVASAGSVQKRVHPARSVPAECAVAQATSAGRSSRQPQDPAGHPGALRAGAVGSSSAPAARRRPMSTKSSRLLRGDGDLPFLQDLALVAGGDRGVEVGGGHGQVPELGESDNYFCRPARVVDVVQMVLEVEGFRAEEDADAGPAGAVVDEAPRTACSTS